MESEVKKELQNDDEIDLRELFLILWTSRIKIIVITALFASISFLYSLSIPNLYKAEILIVPSQTDGSDLSAISREIGGLASLAGVNLSSTQGTEAQIAIEIMNSWSFIEAFIDNNDIAVEVYAAEGWNKKNNELKINENLYDLRTRTWLFKDSNTGEQGPPSSWKLFQAFSERLTISEDKALGLISLSIEHYSPYTARKWSNLYLKAINSHMQKRELLRINNNLNYLNAQIEKSSISEMKEIFYKIIEEQIKSKMLAQASPEFAFSLVSPSMIPEEKSQPQRGLISVLGTLLGALLSILYVLVMYYTQRKSD